MGGKQVKPESNHGQLIKRNHGRTLPSCGRAFWGLTPGNNKPKTRKDQMSSTINTIDVGQFQNCVFFSLTVRKPGVRCKVKDFAALETYLEQLHAENGNDETSEPAVELPKGFKGNGGGAVKVTKRILLPRKPTKEDPRPDPYEAACTFLNETKEKLTGRFGRALPSKIKEGLFVVRKELVQEFEDELRASLEKLSAEYLPAVKGDYVFSKERARGTPVKQGGLGPLYREADYPTADDFCGCFGLEWQWLALGVPEDLPAALRAEAAEKLERQFTEAAEEVKLALREAFADLIDHATEKLKPAAPGEKQAVFRDSMIGNIAQFCQVFESRNLMNDTDLASLVGQAKQLLTGLNPDRLRKYANVRQETQEKFEAIKAQLDAMITVKKGRKFNLSED
ncbi:hypothetical protein KGP36_02735 [Patescibacteria group bacterium]|nr:hypothetical protein [Patescibacteria group bacterium]